MMTSTVCGLHSRRRRVCKGAEGGGVQPYTQLAPSLQGIVLANTHMKSIHQRPVQSIPQGTNTSRRRSSFSASNAALSEGLADCAARLMSASSSRRRRASACSFACSASMAFSCDLKCANDVPRAGAGRGWTDGGGGGQPLALGVPKRQTELCLVSQSAMCTMTQGAGGGGGRCPQKAPHTSDRQSLSTEPAVQNNGSQAEQPQRPLSSVWEGGPQRKAHVSGSCSVMSGAGWGLMCEIALR